MLDRLLLRVPALASLMAGRTVRLQPGSVLQEAADQLPGQARIRRHEPT